MRTKKTLIGIYLLSMLILATVALGFATPMPINGKVVGEYVSGLEIKVTNLRSGIVYGGSTVSSGEYLVEWANSPMPANQIKHMAGDQFKIEIVACASNPACTRTVTYLSQPEIYNEFDVTGILSAPPVVDDPEPEPEPEPEVVDKVTSNGDQTGASVDAYYGDEISICVGNNKLVKLIDTILEFNDEDYDVSEKICVDGRVLTSIDDKDYGTDPYFIVGEEEVEYRYIFDDGIPTGDISEDEPLKIVFSGEAIEIIKASAYQISIISGEEHDVIEGETVTLEGGDLSITHISADAVKVSYGGETETIGKEDIGDIGDIQIYVVNTFEDDDQPDSAELRIAADVKEVITNGDDYKDSDDWKWIIELDASPQVIGLTNQNEYKYLDEDYKPFKLGDSLVLPNDYSKITFSGLDTPTMTDITFKVKDGYLVADGTIDDAFSFGSDEYDRLYINTAGFHDEDKVFITNEPVRIGDSDVSMILGSLKILDLTIELDLSDILHGIVSFISENDQILDHMGLIFKDAEDAIQDKNGFDVSVPEERPEVTITVGDPGEIIGIPVEPVVCPDAVECDAAQCEKVQCGTCPIAPTCPSCPVINCPSEKVCPVCEDCGEPEGGIKGLIGYIIALVIGLGGGFKFYKNRAGGVTILHRHLGIRGYHDPDIKHRNDQFAHARLRDDPKKFMSDLKKINEEGGL